MWTVTLFLHTGALFLTFMPILIDFLGADPYSLSCRIGLCRKAQIVGTLKDRPSVTHHADITGFRRLIAMSPADAYAWAALAEYLNSSPSTYGDARTALDRAVELAPAVPQIRMRRANLCLEMNDYKCVLYDGREVIQQTATYDGILFSYYKTFNIELEATLKLGLPEHPRAARSWMIYVTRYANSSFHILRTWDWLLERGLADATTACRVTHELVSKGDPETAWRIWSDYRVAGAYGQDEGSDRLTNAKFARNPVEAPFDWAVTPQPGVGFRRERGLEVSFKGEANLSMANVRQASFVRPGQHRLVVDVSHEGLTTDQGPYVRLFDAEQPERLMVQTEMFRGSAGRRTVTVEFLVPPGSRLLTVQLERRPSEKFDNKLTGTLHLYQVSLFELNAKHDTSGVRKLKRRFTASLL